MRPGLQRLSTRDAPLMLALSICLAALGGGNKDRHGRHHRSVLRRPDLLRLLAGVEPEPRVHGINEFLSPFFFFTMGARLDIHVFSARCHRGRDRHLRAGA